MRTRAFLHSLRGWACFAILSFATAFFASAQAGNDCFGAKTGKGNRTWESFGPMPLPLQSTREASIKIVTDLGILAPGFQSYARNDQRIIRHFTSGVPGASEAFARMVGQTGLGHAAPYLYSSIYHALGRIYYGISLDNHVMGSKPLFPRAPLKGTITVRVFSNRDEFAARARKVVGGSADAYWDSSAQELGLVLDLRLFSWATCQQEWKHDDQSVGILKLEEYLNTWVRLTATHELFHAVQDATGTDEYRMFPLLSEGTAQYVQENVLGRDEDVRLIEAIQQHTAKNDQLLTQCMDSWEKSTLVPYGFEGITYMYKSFRYIRRNARFSLTKLLSLKTVEFNRAAPEESAARYSLAFATIDFLRWADADTIASWNRVLTELIEKDEIRATRTDAASVDQKFMLYLERWAGKYWAAPNAHAQFVAAANLCDLCLRAADFITARRAALAMIAFEPEWATGPLYLGDVFYRVDRPILALKYYTAADDQKDPSAGGEFPPRIQSRLGDAYERLGAFEEAIQQYRRIENDSVSGLPTASQFGMTLMLLRGQLKVQYYELTRKRGIWKTDASWTELERYIRLLLVPEPEIAPEYYRQRMSCQAQQDAQCLVKLAHDRYASVVAQMKQELGSEPTLAPSP